MIQRQVIVFLLTLIDPVGVFAKNSYLNVPPPPDEPAIESQ
jgi:hypothetical protein